MSQNEDSDAEIGDQSENDVQMNTEGSSDEESDSASEEDSMDDKLIQKYIEILARIDKNKYNYDDYVQLVDTAQYVFFFIYISMGKLSLKITVFFFQSDK